MKPVIDKALSKDGEIIVRFHPSARMILFAQMKAKYSNKSDTAICRELDISPNLPGTWRKKYGSLYTEWLDEFQDNYTEKKAELLEAVGMVNATQGNFQFWRELARTHNVIKDEVKTQHLTINTDFSAILIGDLDEARKRILQEVRGVAIEDGSRMANRTVEEQHQGPRDRAGDVQEVSVEIPNTLDSNGRLSE